MRAKQTLNRNMTVATRQSASINVTGCNAIRKGAVAWSKKKKTWDGSDGMQRIPVV